MGDRIEGMTRPRGLPLVDDSEKGEKPIDVHELINKFFRRKRLFIYVSVPLFLIAVIYHFAKPYSPIYRATFDVGIARERPSDDFFSGSRASEIPTLQIGSVTQRVITNLLSVNTAERVADELSFYTVVDDARYSLRTETVIKQDFYEPLGPFQVKFHDASVVTTPVNGGETKDSIIGRCSIYRKGDEIKNGALNEFIDLGACDIKIKVLEKDALNKTFRFTIFPRQKMALALRNSITIRVLEADRIEREFGTSGVPGSGEGASRQLVMAKSIFPGMNLIGILRIDVHWGDPGDAMRIANAVSRHILLADWGEKSQQFQQSKLFIDSQLVFYKDKLNKQEEEIRRFKEVRSISNLEASTQALISQVSELESRKNQLQIEQNVLGNLNLYLMGPAGEDAPNYAVSMLSDEVLRDLYSSLLQSDAELRAKSREYSNNHPKVMEIRARLAGLREQLKEEIRKRMESVKTEIAGYNTQIRMLQGKLDNVPHEEVVLARFERDRETAEKLYTYFAEKLEETRVQEAAVTSDVKIINPPLLDDAPVNARGRLKSSAMALVLAVMAGAFAVIAVEYLDKSIKDPERELAKVGMPLFESIPALEDEKDLERSKDLLVRLGLTDILEYVSKYILRKKTAPSPSTPRLLNTDTNSPEFEAFRKLVINLEFAQPSESYRVLYVTSTGPEEGKTFLALNLGYVIGAMGKKAIVVDTDFRKGAGHRSGVTSSIDELGLFDVLSGRVYAKSAKRSMPVMQDRKDPKCERQLDLLPIGRIPADPFLLLESEKMKELISELKKEYDYVVIDGVPLLLFADAAYLARHADGVLLAARYGRTTLKELERSRDILQNADAAIIGVVMNDVPRKRGSYYYNRYYKYYSKYYKIEKL